MTNAPDRVPDLAAILPARCLDLRGETCPTSTVETMRVLDELATGEVLEVTSDYYPARSTIPYHCEHRGYPYTLVDDVTDERSPAGRPVWRIRIRKS